MSRLHYTHPPTTDTNTTLSFSLCFIPSHIRASHSLTTTTDTTTNTSHPSSSYPLLIFTLNLVLLSGLRLNTPSEISHFKKIHEQLEPPCCITAAITGFFADTAWRLKRLRDSKQNQVSWSSDKLSYWEGAFAKTLCDMMIGRQAQIPYEYVCNCLCLWEEEKKNQARTWLVNICKKSWNAFGKVGYISVLLGVDYFLFLSLKGLSDAPKSDFNLNRCEFILQCSISHTNKSPIIQFHPHPPPNTIKKGWNKNLIILSCFMLACSLTNNLLNSISACLLAALEWTPMYVNDRWYFSNFIRFRYRNSSPSINSFWNTCTPCLIYCPCETEFIVIECGAMKLDCIVCVSG